MRTLKLTVSESAYKKLKVIFSLFGAEDLRVENDIDLSAQKKYLEKELAAQESVVGEVYSKYEVEEEDEEMDYPIDPRLILTFEEAKQRVADVVARIERGEEKFYTLEEVEASTEAILKKYGA